MKIEYWQVCRSNRDTDGSKKEGKLMVVTEKEIVLDEEKEREEKGIGAAHYSHFSEIKATLVQIKF